MQLTIRDYVKNVPLANHGRGITGSNHVHLFHRRGRKSNDRLKTDFDIPSYAAAHMIGCGVLLDER